MLFIENAGNRKWSPGKESSFGGHIPCRQAGMVWLLKSNKHESINKCKAFLFNSISNNYFTPIGKGLSGTFSIK
jgi:hypothetical protein